MKTLRIPVVVYELLLEKSKIYKSKSVEDFLNTIARCKEVKIKS